MNEQSAEGWKGLCMLLDGTFPAPFWGYVLLVVAAGVAVMWIVGLWKNGPNLPSVAHFAGFFLLGIVVTVGIALLGWGIVEQCTALAQPPAEQ